MTHKRIPLLPTPFFLDVFITEDIAQVERGLSQLYGGHRADYPIQLSEGQQGLTGRFDSIIFMVIPDYIDDLVAHEATHVVFELGELIPIKWDYMSQEFFAYYIDYIIREIKEMKE